MCLRVVSISLFLFACSFSFSGYGDTPDRVESALTRYPLASYPEQLRILNEIAEMGVYGLPALDLLIEELEDPRDRIREAAAVGIEGMGAHGVKAVPALRKALGDQNVVVAAQAAMSLGSIGPEARLAQKDLIERSSTFGVHMLESCIIALGQIGADFDAVEPLLRQAYLSKESGVRKAAVETASQCDPDGSKSLPYLSSLIHDPDKWVRGEVCVALGGFPAEVLHSVPLLVEALEDKDYFVRMKAARALGALGPVAHRGAEALVRSLYDESPRVALESARALKNMGSAAQNVRQKLVNASTETEGELKRAILQALASIQDE